MSHPRFERFLDRIESTLASRPSEPTLFTQVSVALQDLLDHDDWLPQSERQVDATRYQSYPLYVDPMGRFSVISFVWGPGQRTGVHDHTVWGLVGVLQGAELCEEYARQADGSLKNTHSHRLPAGLIDRVSPTIGDIHLVSNALTDAPTISIHVYGGDIGAVARSIYALDGTVTPFVSGYSRTSPWVAAR